MDKPLSTWYCDVCDKKITNLKKGYVVWDTNKENKVSKFNIIHKKTCDKKKHISSAELQDFYGIEGMSYLISKINNGLLLRMNGKKDHCQVSDFDEYMDFFRRMQVPFYEEARRYFENVPYASEHVDYVGFHSYLPETLEKIIREYGEKE
tara:strand:- start:355 stop:804 length:450 start_codon:yes stop_codon:yes gene_type:complete